MKSNPHRPSWAQSIRRLALGSIGVASLLVSVAARGEFDPGTALSFDGGTRSVQVAHTAALNSYPLTVSAWIKTSSTSAAVAGIASKYASGSSVGWSVIAANGHVYAWYFLNGSRYVGPGALGMDGGAVADGEWHHVAFVVDATGGTLYVDSQPRVQNAWVGAAGATTTTQPLQIGRYSSAANSFIGDLDEVSVWSKALSAPEVNDLGRRGPTGGEGDLLALWTADDGGGTQLTDSSPNLRHGTLTNSPAWVTSTAPITRGLDGDVLGSVTSAAVARRIIITSVPGQETFPFNVGATIRRYDNTATTTAASVVPVTLSWQLLDVTAGGAPISLLQSTLTQSVAVPAHAGGNASVPTRVDFNAVVPVAPAQPTDLLPRHSYKLAVTMSNTDPTRGEITNNTVESPLSTLLALSGKLFAGALETRFTGLTNDPVAAATSGLDDPTLTTTLAVAAGAGYLPERPNFTFGGNPGFAVQIFNTNGDAVIVDGSSPVLADRPPGPVAPGSALSFDGAPRLVSVPHSAALDGYPLTVSAWIRTTNTDNTINGIVSKYADGSFNGWTVFTNLGNIEAFYIANGSNYILGPARGLNGGFVADGQWHHVVMVIDGTGGTLYVDAVARHHLNWVGTPSACTTTQPLQIGRYHTYPNGFAGEIDEVSVWSAPLSGDKVFDLGRRAPVGTEPGLLALWKGDDGTGLQLTDSTANGRHGTLTNSPAWVTSTAPIHRAVPDPLTGGAAVSFNAGFDPGRLVVPHSPAFNSYPLTVSAWIKTTTNDASVRGIVCKYTDGIPNGWAIFLSGGRIYAWYSLSGSRQVFTAPWGLQSQFVADGQWHHLALVIDPGGGTLYVDAAAHSHLNWTGTPGACTTTQPLQIGRYYNYGTGFLGLIDEVSVWTEGMTAAQVCDLQRRSPLGNEACLEALWTFDEITNFQYPDATEHQHTADYQGFTSNVPSTAPVRRRSPEYVTVAGARTEPQKITLTTNGLSAGALTVGLPAGFGYSASRDARLLEDQFTVNDVPLDGALAVTAGTLSWAPPGGGTRYAAEETKPLWISFTGLEWDVGARTFTLQGTGGLTFVREPEYQAMETAAADAAQPLVDPAMAIIRSNDGWYRSAFAATGAVTVNTGADASARLSMTMEISGGSFRTHFPKDVAVSWFAAGTAVVQDDVFNTASSGLANVDPLGVPYHDDCPDDCVQPLANGGVATAALTPDGAALRITPEGGLQAPGTFGAPVDVRWGHHKDSGNVERFAHQALGFTAGSFYMPGQALAGPAGSLSAPLRAAELLLSGYATPADPDAVERPFTTGYTAGLADYAGMNFRTGAGRQGRSRLAAVDIGPYPLTAAGKYCARLGGVTGIHQAVEGTVQGSFPLSGYQTTLNRLAFSFLDSNIHKSLVDGTINFPAPVGVLLDFSEIRFTCLGGLKAAILPPDTPEKSLVYWPARLRPLTLEFLPKKGQPCNPALGYAVLGAECSVSHVPQRCHGALGIYPNGTFMPPGNPDAEVDSRLALPSVIKIDGPQGQADYTLTPVSTAYYNAAPVPYTAAQNGQGFVTFAASMQVGFFESVGVQALTTGLSSAPATEPIYLVSGTAWSEAGQTFFNNKNFDAANRGRPANVSRADYQSQPAWFPHVVKNWIGLVDFDIPVKWSPGFRAFSSETEGTANLPVFSVKSKATYLGSEVVDLRFAEGFEFSGVTLANFLYDKTSDFTGFGDAMQRALNGATAAALGDGLKSLDHVLKDDPGALLEAPLSGALASAAESLRLSLTTILPGQTQAQFEADADQIIDAQTAALVQAALQAPLLQGAGGDAGLLARLQSDVVKARGTVNAIRAYLARAGGTGPRQIASQLAKELLRNQFAQFLGNIADSALQDQINALDPVFDTLERTLTEVDGALARVQTALQASGTVATQLSDTLALPVPLGAVSVEAKAALKAYIRTLNVSRANGNPVAELSPAVVNTALQRRLRDAFYLKGSTTGVQTVLREQLGGADALLRQALGSVFQQLNLVVRDAVSRFVAGGLASAAKPFLGPLADSTAMAKIDGSAQIRGDSLKCLRLDGEARLKIGVEIGFHAYLQIKDTTGEGPDLPGGCSPDPGTRRVEITLGADNVALDWALGTAARAYVETRFTFDDPPGAAPPYLAGFSGKLGLSGGFKFEALEFKEGDFGVSFGAGEGYLALNARVKVSGWEFAGGAFVGRACSHKPLLIVDKTVDQPDSLFSAGELNTPFTGIYVKAEGWVPLNELLGIPSSCLLELAGGIGQTFFTNLEDLSRPQVGGRILLGVEGEVLCIVSIHVEITLGGSVRIDLNKVSPAIAALVFINPLAAALLAEDLRLVGTASASGDIGPCPFCISFSFKITVFYENGDFSADF